MSKFLYFIKEACINFVRNWSTGIGAVITIFLSLFVIGLFMIGTFLVNNIIGNYEDQVSISVYISDWAPQEDIDALTNYVNGLEYVESVTWVSKEQALANFAASRTTNNEIIEQLDGANPLPASLVIHLTDAQQVENVATQIKSNPLFTAVCDEPEDPNKSINYGAQTVSRLFTVVNGIRAAAVAVVALLVFVTFIFINNTIRLAVMARRREIAIMRLVGASNGFIRGPFIMEGVIQSLLGAFLAIGLLAVVKNVALPQLQGFVNFLDFTISPAAYMQVNILLLVIGLVIGILGCSVSMRRYLKV